MKQTMAMAGYTKLFNSILASTIWKEDNITRIVWITLLAMADKNGVAEGSVPGLAGFANVSIDDCKSALHKLMSPDPYSRTKEHEGRRVEECEGGWFLLNHGKFRAKMSADERREYNRVKQQEYRQKVSANVKDVNDSQRQSAICTHTEAEADTKAVILPKEVVFWNLNCGKLPKVAAMSSERMKHLKTRRQDPFWSENFEIAVVRVTKSDFCCGKNDRKWRADFDWMLQSSVVAKIMEGKYDNRVKPEIVGGRF